MAVSSQRAPEAAAPRDSHARTPARPPSALARRATVENIRPQVDAGRFPVKRTVGEQVRVVADIFADGHDLVHAVLRDRPSARGPDLESLDAAPGGSMGGAPAAVDRPGAGGEPVDPGGWRETPMALLVPGTDEWSASFTVSDLGWHEYQIVAWVDRFRTWRRDLEKKAAAGQDVNLELLEGALLVREAAARAEQIGGTASDCRWLLERADELSESTPAAARVRSALAPDLLAKMDEYADRSGATRTAPLRVWVDRERARCGAWYEMFPRSAGSDPARSGTFREACELLPGIADLGFDVVYLPPIHPIGRSFRKGANNTLTAKPGDPGSPWAIGSEEGGHTAVDPGLGTLDDFEAFRAEAERLGLEIALDLAWQCSPDHPWVKEHPEWFRHRPDGTIKYAENPPKRYQDIYPLDFACDDWRALWAELFRVTWFWVEHGVRMFRVDNPHTKSFGFWEWLIHEVHARDPRVIFLSEAFTRPAVMRYLAKAGFTQSYTYFTWRNSKSELTEYFTELTATSMREYFRPNLFANTPDILHAYLQQGGRPAFRARLLLAATLGASYGIYSGFELCENDAVPGTEEYANSEKYQYRKRNWNTPGNIKELIARVNGIRRAEPALQVDWTLRFHDTDNPNIIAYSKAPAETGRRDRAAGGIVFVVVNLDPHYMQHGFVRVPADALRSLGIDPEAGFTARDLLDDVDYRWRGEWNYVRFDPEVRQGHVLKLLP